MAGPPSPAAAAAVPHSSGYQYSPTNEQDAQDGREGLAGDALPADLAAAGSGDGTIRYSFKDNPTVQQFSNDSTFITAIMGPFGSGKSSGCLMKIIKLARRYQKPGPDGVIRVRWAVVRNTYPQLRDTTIKTVVDWLPPRYFGTLKLVDHDYLITGIEGLEIELMFRALDRPDHVQNLLSLELTGAWINEYREIPRAIFEALQGRVGRFPSVRNGGCGWYGIIMDSNPPDEDSFYYELFEETRPDNAVLYRQPSGLSPEAENLKYLPVGYYENLAKGKRKEWITVFVKGQYGYQSEGDAVTPEYGEGEYHRSRVDLLPQPGALGVRFWDGGLNPTCVIGQVTGSGHLQVIRTLRLENAGMKQLIVGHVVPYLSSPEWKVIERWRDIGDPALETRDQSDSEATAAGTIEQLLGGAYEAGPVSWEDRREALRQGLDEMMMGKPWVQVSRGDKVLHACLRGGWHYKRSPDGKVIRNLPVKDKHSHPGDAFGYGLCVLLGRAKKAVEKKEPALKAAVAYGAGGWMR